MSKLEELLKQYCPNGVERKPLSEIADIVRGVRITKKQLVPDGKYTVISGGVEPMGRFGMKNRDACTITIASYGAAGFVNFIEEPFWANDVCLSVYPDENVIDKKYLYYFLKKLQEYIFANVIHAVPEHIPTEFLKGLEIPIPPLPVQQEIVRILDSFTALTAELQAELQARKKQYEYYRDRLLKVDSEEKTNWLPLSMLTTFIRNGYNYKADGDRTKKFKITRIETISTGRINMEKVGSSDLVSSSYMLMDGDILFSHINSLPYLGNTAYYSEEYGELYHGMNLLCFRSNTEVLNHKYLYYVMKSSLFRKYVERYAKHSCNQYSLSTSDIKKWEIPVPSLLEQKEIVAMIDSFDETCNSIISGLPAELNLRKKQYEFYREKLLSFK